MKRKTPRSDDYDFWLDPGLGGNGSASTLTALTDWKPPKREFAPGFHGANPGPSYDETPPRRQRKRKTP